LIVFIFINNAQLDRISVPSTISKLHNNCAKCRQVQQTQLTWYSFSVFRVTFMQQNQIYTFNKALKSKVTYE